MNRDNVPPNVPTAELPPVAPRGFSARLRNYFLTGLIVAGPIAITIYLTWWFVTWVDGLAQSMAEATYLVALSGAAGGGGNIGVNFNSTSATPQPISAGTSAWLTPPRSV